LFLSIIVYNYFMNREWLEERKAEIEKAYADAGVSIDKLNAERSELKGAFNALTQVIDKLEEVEIMPPKKAKGNK
jgi:hypothetical protein